MARYGSEKYDAIRRVESRKPLLTEAFKRMRKEGFVARQNFACCMSCGMYELGQYVDERPGKFEGIVFYHRQDAQRLRDGEDVYLAFSSVHDDDDEGTIAVGRKVVEILESVGLPYEWDDDPMTRIRVCMSAEIEQQSTH